MRNQVLYAALVLIAAMIGWLAVPDDATAQLLGQPRWECNENGCGLVNGLQDGMSRLTGGGQLIQGGQLFGGAANYGPTVNRVFSTPQTQVQVQAIPPLPEAPAVPIPDAPPSDADARALQEYTHKWSEQFADYARARRDHDKEVAAQNADVVGAVQTLAQMQARDSERLLVIEQKTGIQSQEVAALREQAVITQATAAAAKTQADATESGLADTIEETVTPIVETAKQGWMSYLWALIQKFGLITGGGIAIAIYLLWKKLDKLDGRKDGMVSPMGLYYEGKEWLDKRDGHWDYKYPAGRGPLSPGDPDRESYLKAQSQEQ